MSAWNDSGCSDGQDWDDSGCSDGESEDVSKAAIEAEYKKTFERIKPQILECCKMAEQAYKDAVRLAEAHGVPFNANVIGRHHTYIPQIPEEKREVVNAVAGTWINSESEGGWTNSSTNC